MPESETPLKVSRLVRFYPGRMHRKACWWLSLWRRRTWKTNLQLFSHSQSPQPLKPRTVCRYDCYLSQSYLSLRLDLVTMWTLSWPNGIAPLSSCSLSESIKGLRSFISSFKVLSRVRFHWSQLKNPPCVFSSQHTIPWPTSMGWRPSPKICYRTRSR